MISFLLALVISNLSVAQESAYDLLSSLNPDSALTEGGAESRQPASVDSTQLQVQSQLPEAKQKKSAQALQWEVLNKKSSNLESGEEEHGE